MPNVSYEVEIPVEIYCDKCGAGLCLTVDIKRGNAIYVPPCTHCMDDNYREGLADGDMDGYSRGHSEGYQEGRSDGYSEGFEDGRD